MITSAHQQYILLALPTIILHHNTIQYTTRNNHDTIRYLLLITNKHEVSPFMPPSPSADYGSINNLTK